MKLTHRAVPALIALFVCAFAFPASAQDSTSAMTSSGSQAVAANDAVFTAFFANLDKTNDTLNRLTTLLNSIMAHSGQNPPAAPAGQ